MSTNDWIEDLSKRGHVLHGHLDHFSILLEEIPDYVKDPTFNQQKLRDVYTIARAGYRQDDIVILQPVDKTKEIDDIYAYFHQSYLKASKEEMKHNRVHSTRVKFNDIYKFYGTLRFENAMIIIDVHFILNVENPTSCLKTLALTSKTCCKSFHQCYHSDRMKLLLQEWWDKFKKNRNGGESQSQTQTQTSQSQSQETNR